MRAIVQQRYGPPHVVLELRDIARPVAGHGEVLVRVRATSVHADVWHAVTGQPYVLRLMGSGIRAPRNPVPGTDMAGVVEDIGAGATRFRPGDPVFGEVTPANQWRNGGAFAEYVAAREDGLARTPQALSFEEAAAVPTSALIALTNLRDQGRVQPGQRVLVNGAGGSVGVFAVQLATAFGAHVTAVDSADKLDLLRALGADRVIDYHRQDFTALGERYDLVFDIASDRPFAEVRRALTPNGTFVLVGHDRYGRSGHRWMGSLGRILPLLAVSPFLRQIPGIRSGASRQENLATLVMLIEAGKLRPVVDRTFPLADVPAAIGYLSEGRAKGRVVITVA